MVREQSDPNLRNLWYALSIGFSEAYRSNSVPPGLEFLGDEKNPQNGFINWVAGGQRSWGLTAAAFGPDPITEISQRTVSVEPMSIVLNLGISGVSQHAKDGE